MEKDADQSGYYSEDSEFNSVSMTLVTTSEASTAREGWNREQEGTFDCHLNQKVTLSKLNDNSSTNNLWIWLADAYRYVDSGCSMDALENEINRSPLKWILGSVVLSELHAREQHPHYLEQDEADRSPPAQ